MLDNALASTFLGSCRPEDISSLPARASTMTPFPQASTLCNAITEKEDYFFLCHALTLQLLEQCSCAGSVLPWHTGSAVGECACCFNSVPCSMVAGLSEWASAVLTSKNHCCAGGSSKGWELPLCSSHRCPLSS